MQHIRLRSYTDIFVVIIRYVAIFMHGLESRSYEIFKLELRLVLIL